SSLELRTLSAGHHSSTRALCRVPAKKQTSDAEGEEPASLVTLLPMTEAEGRGAKRRKSKDGLRIDAAHDRAKRVHARIFHEIAMRAELVCAGDVRRLARIGKHHDHQRRHVALRPRPLQKTEAPEA